MIRSRHCALCENEIMSLEKGVTCRLTGRKPDFIKTCRDIKLDEKFLAKLENTNLELERIRKEKNRDYLTFYVLIIIGFLLIIGSEFYADLFHGSRYNLVYRVSAIAGGITILMRAYFSLNRFRDKLKIAEYEKNKIDAVLEKYRISYTPNIDYKEKIHGTQEVIIKLKFKNWTNNHTTTTYKIDY